MKNLILVECETFVVLELTSGHSVLVSRCDVERVAPYRWHASFGSRSRKWYCRGVVEGKKVSMHRFLMQPERHLVVDHVNRDSLDNRRDNLEIITQRENMLRCPTWKRAGQPAVVQMSPAIETYSLRLQLVQNFAQNQPIQQNQL